MWPALHGSPRGWLTGMARGAAFLETEWTRPAMAQDPAGDEEDIRARDPLVHARAPHPWTQRDAEEPFG